MVGQTEKGRRNGWTYVYLDEGGLLVIHYFAAIAQYRVIEIEQHTMCTVCHVHDIHTIAHGQYLSLLWFCGTDSRWILAIAKNRFEEQMADRCYPEWRLSQAVALLYVGVCLR